MDETYVKVGQWKYLFRAVDRPHRCSIWSLPTPNQTSYCARVI